MLCGVLMTGFQDRWTLFESAFVNFIWYRHTKMSCRVVLHFVAMVIVVGDIRFVPRMNKMEQAILNQSINQY